MTSLVDLPHDVLTIICQHLSAAGLLSLSQTCRGLYKIGCDDYLWHSLLRSINLPLDISPDTDPRSLSGRDTKALVVRALKLDRNWRRSRPQVRRVVPLIDTPADTFVDELVFLPGSQWLVTAQVAGGVRTRVTLWLLGDVDKPLVVGSYDLRGRPRSFTAYLDSERKVVIICGIMMWDRQSFIKAHSINIDECDRAITPVATIYDTEVSKLPHLGMLCSVSVHKDTIAANFVVMGGDTSSRKQTENILFHNFMTNATLITKTLVPSFAGSHSLRFTHSRFITATHHDDLFGEVLDISKIASSLSDAAPSKDEYPFAALQDKLSLTSFLLQSSHHIHMDYYLSVGTPHPYLNRDILCALALPWPGSSYPAADLYQLNLRTGALDRHEHFSVANSEHVIVNDEVHLGPSGRRAVWLCGRAGNATVMKWACGGRVDGEEVAGRSSPMIDTSSGLPFRVEECHRLAFDEATCRMCVATHSGCLYLLDFA
ncbi:hypothetical protein CONPUDRAFT_150910 [Coniophora puteana RWD-64-598 SS2]|uniref:F-box domain-containing protein n=1 Tax=Coniophora puteana (strain RWD-64-598) TaxID=741705 RepID=A0A5M3MXN0_CONPW|nr:uncharacterized protein CONPUDRAFT_150910 [Coniophora puteana RWD-64-598 SS2]EIW83860.1 hypothetical protein CONPUDRAFT_150910 [Coniophora puteana RWD-64-598 SS2]